MTRAVISSPPFPRRVGWLLLAACGLLRPVRAEVLTLEDCLRETAAHNPGVIAEQFEVQRATGTRLLLRSRALATANIGGTLGYQGSQNAEEQRFTSRGPDGTTVSTIVTTPRSGQELLVGTGQITQPIFDVAIPASWRRGDIGILAARQSYYTVAANQLYQARTYFLRALYQHKRVELLRQNEDVIDRNIRTQEQLVSAGVKGRQGLLAAQVQRGNFDPGVLDAVGSYRSSLATLLQTMGRQPGVGAGGDDPLDHITLSGSLDETPLTFDAAAAGQEALAHRPDILALREQVRGLREDANITRAGYFPRVQLYLAGELLPQSFVRSSRPNAIRSTDQVQTTEIRPGVRGDWTVIDTGNVQGEAHRLDAVRGELEVGLQRLERSVPGELAGIRATINSNAESLKTLRGNVDVAQNTLNIITAGVAQGVNSQLEFLDAQSGLLNTRLGILDAAYTLSVSRTEYHRITGQYLRYVFDDPASSQPYTRPRH